MIGEREDQEKGRKDARKGKEEEGRGRGRWLSGRKALVSKSTT